jgi:hypothetical protein
MFRRAQFFEQVIGFQALIDQAFRQLNGDLWALGDFFA